MKTKTINKVLLAMLTVVLLSQCENETFTPTITTASIINITQSTATSGGNVTDDGKSMVTARGVCWDTTPNPTISYNTTTNDGTGAGSFISSIAGLTENTIYYVRAYATNLSGTAYGEELLFYSGIGILNQEQTTVNYGFAVGSKVPFRWQNFIPTLNNISTIEVFIHSVTPTGNCTIQVQSENGKLTYAEQTFSASLLPQFDWFKMEIISIPATPGTKYRIRISRSDTHTPDNAIYWRGNTNSNYPGYCDVNSSRNWANYDYAFKTYGF